MYVICCVAAQCSADYLRAKVMLSKYFDGLPSCCKLQCLTWLQRSPSLSLHCLTAIIFKWHVNSVGTRWAQRSNEASDTHLRATSNAWTCVLRLQSTTSAQHAGVTIIVKRNFMQSPKTRRRFQPRRKWLFFLDEELLQRSKCFRPQVN